MVDYNFYCTQYYGEEMDGELFNKLAHKSYDIIMAITGNAEETDNVKKAECAEIEFLSKNGGADALAGNDKSQFVSESIGGYSYSKSDKISSTQYVNGLPIAPMVWTYIRKRGVVLGLG